MNVIENIYPVTKKLLGDIEPQGESNIDALRFENLEGTIYLIDKLIDDVAFVARHKNRQESSMKKSGVFASEYLKQLKESIS